MKKLTLLLLVSTILFSGCFLIPFDVTIKTKSGGVWYDPIKIKDAEFDGMSLPSEGEITLQVNGGERILNWTIYDSDGSERDFSETYMISGNARIIITGGYSTMK
ncbi:MAG: hypothetical protein WC910_10095 [Bacteroidales bacterium]